ncbi:hypothetical protein LUZ60_004068 [Juncus effusus]|nr:hypothetical protein LUZ60_004068 [Juncus effusus]
MAKTLSSSPQITIQGDYIDMDLSPKILSPRDREFEFKMGSNSNQFERETNAYPADELFYKGNLLPLHLPPRIELVQKLLHESKEETERDFKEKFAVKSSSNGKKHWPKRLKFFKQTNLGSKIKASRDYLVTLFTKTNFSNEEQRDPLHFKVISPPLKFTTDRDKLMEEETGHRKSFSGVIRRRLMGNNKSSQVSGLSISSSNDLDCVLEEENSIQGAIAYCKRTQENLIPQRKSISDLSFCSFAVPRISVGCENQEREKIYRG